MQHSEALLWIYVLLLLRGCDYILLKKFIFPEDELFQYTVIFFLLIVKGKQELKKKKCNYLGNKFVFHH